MKILQGIGDLLDRICGFLIVIIIGAMVVITTAQIICRIWFTALSWSEEVTRFLLIWSTFLGATCVYRRSGNIAITAVQALFPEKVQKGLRIGYLAQQGELSGKETVQEVLEKVFDPVVRMEEEMRSLDQGLSFTYASAAFQRNKKEA